MIDEILSIMKHVLNEEASQALLDVILLNLIKEGKASICTISCFGSYSLQRLFLVTNLLNVKLDLRPVIFDCTVDKCMNFIG